jgi:hypothetical protein
MATMPKFSWKFDAARSETKRPELARNPCAPRALPNDDIFLHVKRIDNSRLVRQPDPQAKAECWSTIGAICAVAAVLLTSLAPGVASITAGYSVQALKQDRQRLLDERRSLEVEEAGLRRRQVLEEVAKDRHMKRPKSSQVAHLDSETEAAVASLTPAKPK